LKLLVEVGRWRATVGARAEKLGVLKNGKERLHEVRADAVDSLRIEHDTIGMNLQEHAELLPVVGSSDRNAAHDGLGLGDGAALP
jgi:hypothetical protein